MKVMQIIHGIYNIKSWYEIDKLKDLWHYIQDEKLAYHRFKNSRNPSSLDGDLLERVPKASKRILTLEQKYAALFVIQQRVEVRQ